MAVEEPSVVAAASRAACSHGRRRLRRPADPPIMTRRSSSTASRCGRRRRPRGRAPRPDPGRRRRGHPAIVAAAAAAATRCARPTASGHGGGPHPRRCGEAMGATWWTRRGGDRAAPGRGGRRPVGLRSDPTCRCAGWCARGGRSRSTCWAAPRLCGVERASRFAEPTRCAPSLQQGHHERIDAARSPGPGLARIEAAAHAYAAHGGRYRPLATWKVVGGALRGRIELPLAVGTVGGATRVHPGVRAAFEILGHPRAGELAVILASAGLASNLAALHALANEGIQRGHMRLHRRRCEPEGGGDGRA